MKKYLILLIILKVAFTFIKYDTGLTTNFDKNIDASFVCRNGYSRTATIPFSNTFQNIPQVFFFIDYCELETAEMGYKLSITTITTTSFTALMSCSGYSVYYMQLKWYAIDDQRIEVISNFNMANPDDKTFSIKNPNAQTGFVVMTSIHHIGPLDFLLQISQITTNSVTVSITKVAGKFTNLKQIGYFVVVGVQEAFINLGLQIATGSFSSGTLAIQPNRLFVIALQGFNNYANIHNIRLKTTYTNTATTISYVLATWAYDTVPNSHSQVWIAYQFIVNMKIMKLLNNDQIIQIHINHQNVSVQEQVENKFQIYIFYLYLFQNWFNVIKYTLQMEITIILQINQSHHLR